MNEEDYEITEYPAPEYSEPTPPEPVPVVMVPNPQPSPVNEVIQPGPVVVPEGPQVVPSSYSRLEEAKKDPANSIIRRGDHIHIVNRKKLD